MLSQIHQAVLPTAADLAAGSDPVMAAVRLAGGSLSPAAAGMLFGFEWPLPLPKP